MAARAENKEKKLDGVLLGFATELAHYLIAAGVSSPRFEAIVRLAYFQAASPKAKFGSEKLNQSAVAAMTGLTRPQVRAFARATASPSFDGRDRIEQLIEGWLTDPRFSSGDFNPNTLRQFGKGNTFQLLAQSYGGDVPARSLLRELHRHGYVSVAGGRVSIKKKVRETFDQIRIRRISQALTNLLAFTCLQDSLPPVRTVSSEVTYGASSEKGRRLMQRLTAARLREFLEGLSVAGDAAALESPATAGRRPRRTRTRVAVITEDIE
jgi:hypothetical protein